VVVAEDGPLEVAAFVLWVVALVLGGFGAVTVVLATTSGGESGVAASFAGGMLALGLVAAGITFAVIRAIRRSRTKPLSTYRPVAVFDRAAGVFMDAHGVVVAPLNQVGFQRSMQLTSSSPRLLAVTPHSSRVLARGNPFSGGIGHLNAVLTAAVHGRR
jgi:hypothetical protein